MIPFALSLSTAWLAAGIQPLFPEGPPQLEDAVKLFFDAEPVAGELRGGVLLCRVDVVGDRGWDTFGAIDLVATFTLGTRAPVEVWGPEDRSNAVVSLPAVTLEPGENLKVALEDRDLTEREAIARGSVPYAGALPLRISLDEAQVECRGYSRSSAELRARPWLERAAVAAAVVEVALPDVQAPGLGLPGAAIAEATVGAARAEAWLGSTDDEVKGLRERLRRAAARFDGLAREAIHTRAASLPPPGTPFSIPGLGLEARVVPGPTVTIEARRRKGAGGIDADDIADRVTFLSSLGGQLEASAGVIEDDEEADADDDDHDDEGDGATAEKHAPGHIRRIQLRPLGESVRPELARIDGVLVRLR